VRSDQPAPERQLLYTSADAAQRKYGTAQRNIDRHLSAIAFDMMVG
jgi:hypothetical protein